MAGEGATINLSDEEAPPRVNIERQSEGAVRITIVREGCVTHSFEVATTPLMPVQPPERR